MKKLQTRMLLLILLPTIIFIVGMGIYISITVQQTALDEAEQTLSVNGELLANELNKELDHASMAAITIAESLKGMLEQGLTPSREITNIQLQQFLEQNSNVIAAWTLWKPNAFDGMDNQYKNKPGHDHTGRYVSVWSRDGNEKFIVEPTFGYDIPGEFKDRIDTMMTKNKGYLSEPYIFEFSGKKTLITSLSIPVILNDQTVGIVGVDFSLEALDEKISEVSLYETGYAGLLANNGDVISHPTEELIGEDFFQSDTMIDHEERDLVQQNVLNGEKAQITGFSDSLNGEVYRLFTPVHVTGIDEAWSAYLTVPLSEVTAKSKQMMFTILIICSIVIIVLTCIIIWASRGITTVIGAAVEHGNKMADGDFTQPVPEKYLQRKDELGNIARIFDVLGQNLRQLIQNVKLNADQVLESSATVNIGATESAKVSQEVSKSIQTVAQSAEAQMHSAEESAKAMEDMAHGVQTVSGAANTVADASNTMIEQASNGQTVVQSAVNQMHAIKQGTNETQEIIHSLEDGANKIDNIVSVITDISEQTNLLALNAAIEAARAGEYGKGFAVVADEVRKLADETNTSTENIRTLVSSIQQDTMRAAKSMHDNDSIVQDGIIRMQEVESTFNEMIESIESIVRETMELSAVSEEMSASTEEIAATSEEMASSAEVTSGQTLQVSSAAQQQLASMEEIVNSATHLRGLVDELNSAVSKFKV